MVGRGLGASALAGFLEQAGLDPLLAPAVDRPPDGAPVRLWEPGLRLLERLGLGRPLESSGTRLDGLAWTGGADGPRPARAVGLDADERGRPALVAVERTVVDRLLERRLWSRVRTVDRSVDRIDRTGDGVAVRFEGGIVEQFDVVVAGEGRGSEVPDVATADTRTGGDSRTDTGTGRRGVTNGGRRGAGTGAGEGARDGDGSRTGTGRRQSGGDRGASPGARDGPGDRAVVHHWTFNWPPSVDPPTRPTEAWGPSGTVAIAIPLTETVGLRLLATSAAAPDLSFDAAALRSMARSIGGVPGAALDATIADSTADGPGPAESYGRAQWAWRDEGGVGRVVGIGGAARSTPPASGLAPALAVEDAWVLADALAYGPGRIDDALDDYARRRRGRVAALTAATEEAAFAARVPEGAGRSLRRLAAARTLAFGHCFGDEARAYAADVPQGL